MFRPAFIIQGDVHGSSIVHAYTPTPAQILKVHAYIVLIKSTFLSEPHNQWVVTYIPVFAT